MILNLLNTMLITLGTGASVLNMPKKQIKPPINRQTETNYTLNLNINSAGEQMTTIDERTKQYSVRDSIGGNNTALNVIGTEYRNTYYHTNPSTGVANKYYINENYTMCGTILKITPYNINIETTQRLGAYFQIGINYNDIEPGQEPTYIRIKKTTFSTTQNWDTYINNVNYATTHYIYDIKEEIESPEMGYIYQIQEKTYDLEIRDITENLIQSIYDETEITLTQNNNLYVYTFFEIQTDYIKSLVASLYSMGVQTPSITGRMIIPSGTTEIVDIPGLMFTVLTMPFTFISAAFNLTLFPGTPYQINISNLFMAIIAVMAFIFILKLLIGMKGGM